MIKFKTDLLFISILTAIIAALWLILSIIIKNNTYQIQLSKQQISPLLRIPTYKIQKKFWSQLSNYPAIDKTLIYNPQIQPTTLGQRGKPVASRSASLTPALTASGSVQLNQSPKSATSSAVNKIEN